MSHCYWVFCFFNNGPLVITETIMLISKLVIEKILQTSPFVSFTFKQYISENKVIIMFTSEKVREN